MQLFRMMGRTASNSSSNTNLAKDAREPKTRTQRLRGKEFYHGMINRADVDELLKKDGDYLLRKSQTAMQNGKPQVVLSVYWADRVKHFVVQENDKGDVFFEEGGHSDRDVEALVSFMARKKLPITRQSGCLLTTAIAREDWILTHESITLNEKIGQGQFGEVFKGKLRIGNSKTDVAIKTLREGDQIENQKSFLSEARIMRTLRHDNVIRTYGVAVYEKPLMICMELCEKGSLLKYLRKNKTSDEDKYKWVKEAAKGMAYIASQNLVHRDIAARNCLLTTNLTLKIADFGLTIKATGKTEVQGKVPVKWLARETLQLGAYTRQTDVWSYGVLCWEIYSDGAEPYTGMSNQQAKTQVMLHNYRMDLPKNIPTRVGAIIMRTWDDDPTERPSFKTIAEDLELGGR